MPHAEPPGGVQKGRKNPHGILRGQQGCFFWMFSPTSISRSSFESHLDGNTWTAVFNPTLSDIHAGDLGGSVPSLIFRLFFERQGP